tara:strand:+ start:85 stop:702 length:618 start_codon:yes stop_codon:yes gene_type:complete
MKIEVRAEQDFIYVVNALYPAGVRHLGNLRFPDIGVDYVYVQWSDSPWEEDYYVDLNNNLYALTGAMVVTLSGIVAAWVQDLGQEGNLTVAQEKVQQINVLQLALDTYVRTLIGVEGSKETESFTTQEREAREWTASNAVATPFVDALLAGRSLAGETKQTLVDVIIIKADLYAAAYAGLLGKFHRLTKEIEVATTKAEVLAVVW